ncbi:ArsR family transcriptional regulator [Thermoplasma sp. Kam2015]|uniref:transcriptional regulator n=1 Tax=Thermoplasma sp. Kam2015 TaxID=2094122 RepID=UPI000D928301|nr:transcriptional regulator [Thermoplasma sp. Kam2015]PYB67646.1 ArsR family transcriptional regulator [Thermoplasma sp. Kam2015]
MTEDQGIEDLANDPILSSGARIGILIALFGVGKSTFTDLLRSTGLAKSSLYMHLQVLEKHGLITVKTEFTRARPRAIVRITEAGMKEINHYFDIIKRYFEEKR